MATTQLLYANQYFVTTLNVGGGITDAATTGIIIADDSGIDTTKPGIALINYADPLNTSICEWVEYTSINGSKELVGVTRGSQGFSAKSHSNGVSIAFPFTEDHINRLNAMFDSTGVDIKQIATPASPSSGRNKLYFKSDGNAYSLDSSGNESTLGGASFWSSVPGTPTRVSDTQFTITDTSNANLYDQIFKRGVLLRWLESSTFQVAMVVSSSYGANTVTINLVGDSLTAGFTAMKYCLHMAQREQFIIAGTFPSAATTDLSRTLYLPEDHYILSADLYVKTAGSGTGSTVVDINVSGSTKFTTKPTLTTTGATDLDNVADTPSTACAKDAPVTVDVDSVTATSAPVDGYVYLYMMPVSWRYRS